MVHVFKTSVKLKTEVNIVAQFLNRFGKDISWNFDLTDCDHVLRVETKVVSAKEIISEVQKSGFNCEELKD